MILYHSGSSTHSRFVLLVARNLNVDLDLRSVVLTCQEQYTKEFSKINPRHQVPVLVDYYFKLTESRAIACYLANSNDNKFYPPEPEKRAIVDQYLYMDATYIVPTWYNNVILPIMKETSTKITPEDREKILEMMGVLEEILKETPYFGSDEVTLADMSILGSIGFLIHLGVDFKKYPKLLAWYERLKSLEGWLENDLGAQNSGKRFCHYWDETKEREFSWK